ncbi:MAG: Calx-beta domain-containing protein [Chlamydiota bacterium]|nr:Calx-beta domain-containing protein [Chlamydiota bacterium]
MNLTAPTNATIADAQGEGTITNDDLQPTISISDATVTEGGTLTFTVTLSNASYQDITVDYVTADGTATVADNDYTEISPAQTLTFLSGSTSETISVVTTADTKFELNENLFVNLTAPTNATITDAQGEGTITNDDAQPTISISDETVTEGGTLVFTVTLSNASYQDITVDYATLDGTATVADNDYTVISPAQTLTFLSGSVSETISVVTIADITFEPNENLFVDLTNPTNATILDNQGEGTITNDDAQPTISVSDDVVTEGGVLNFVVTLSNPSYQTVTVLISTADGSMIPATLADNDYIQIINQLITFDPGETSASVTVNTVSDTKFELDEQMLVNLSSPTNATIADAVGDGNILNDDTAPTITIDDTNGGNVGLAEVLEGNPPDTNQLVFSVSLSNLSYQDIVFSYNTIDGSATIADNDYTQVSGGTFTILAGTSSQTFTVDVTADLTNEADEAISLNIEKTSGTVTGQDVFTLIGAGVILNDDAQPTISISDASALEGNALNFTVTLSNPSDQDITVLYSTADGFINAATLADNDYTQVSNQLITFLAGSTSATATVLTTADTNFELDEQLFVNLSSSTNASILDGQGVGTIINDDGVPLISIDDVTVTEGGTLTFTVSLSSSSVQIVTVDYATSDGTATVIDSDYTPISPAQTLTFLPGITSQTISVFTTADTKFELNENLFVDLSAASNAAIADNQGEGTITDNDVQPTISISDASVAEGGTLVFTVTLSNASYQDITVLYSTADGTATVADNDYTPISPAQSLTFLSGSVSETISVVTTADPKFELNENLFVNLTTPTNATILDNQGEGTILNDEALPTISISDATVTEGGTLTFTVTLSHESYQDITVDFSTSDGTATIADNDYTAISPAQTLTFLAGSTSETITVATTADTKFELNENLFVDLTNPTNATIADNQGEGTITDDDVQPTISISDATVTEGGTLTFTVTLSNASYQDITVDYVTADGTATVADNDYTAISPVQTLTLLSGSTSETITVATTADTKFELNENLFVNLTNPTNATIADAQGEGTITDDDVQPTISISDATTIEGGTLVFTVTLSNASYQDITVNYVTADGTATIADNDYTAISPVQTLTFFSGSVSETISVVTIADTTFEPNEQLFVNLTAPTNATILDNEGEGTILNDDGIPHISISDETVVEGGTFTFTVTLNAASTQTVTVEFSTADGTTNPATLADNDYIQVTNQLITFLPGSLSETVSVSTVGDTKFELNEQLFVNLTNATNSLIVDPQGEGIITNDDTAPTVTVDDNNGVNLGLAEVLEGDPPDMNQLTFSVTLTNASYEDIVFIYDTSDGTATLADSDYTPVVGQTFTILAGDTTGLFTVDVTADNTFEPDETVNVALSVTGGSVTGTNSFNFQGVILNDDLAPTVTIDDNNGVNVGLAEVIEGNSPDMNQLTFTVTLSNPSSEDIVFTYNTSDGTATLVDSDYTSVVGQTFTILAGDTTGLFTVDVTADNTFEPDETVNVALSVTGGTVTGPTSFNFQGVILNDDLAPTVTIDDNNGANVGLAEVLEGNAPDMNQLTFTVTLSNPSSEDIVFTYNTSDGTATLADSDYTSVVGQTFTILAGDITGVFTVDVTADNTFEPDETVNVALSVTGGSVTGTSSFNFQGVILNDDLAPTVTIDDNNGANIGLAEVLEGNPPDMNQLTFSVTLSNPSSEDIVFTYNTSDGTATIADSDYTSVIGQTFTILAGDTTGLFTVDVTADNTFEPDETVNVALSVTGGVVTGSTNFNFQGVILADDNAPTVTIEDANGANQGVTEVLEGDPPDMNELIFTVTLSNPSSEDIVFVYNTTDGTATVADDDYTPEVGEILTILAGDTTGTITVAVTADNTYEPDENIELTLNVTSGTVTGATMISAEGVILADDNAPTLTVVDNNGSDAGVADVSEGNPPEDNVITYTVTLSNPSHEDIELTYHTTDGTATVADNDYVPIAPTTVIIPAGSTTMTLSVDINADTTFEANETVHLNINVTGGSVAGSTSLILDGVLINDDTISYNFVIPPEDCEENLLGCYANKIEEIFLPQPLKSTSPTFAFTPFGWTIEILKLVREFGPEIVTSQFFGTADEGNLDGYFTIFITQQPEKPLVIELEAQGISDGSVSQKTVVFTPDNWATPQVIVVKDPNFNPDEASEIITTKVESGDIYRDIDAPDVNIPDNTDKPRDGAENEPEQSK